jgi:two-component system sensor histidine kinase KdpD
MRDRVFEKFFRAMRDGDVSGSKSSGTGMGLAIAHGIIQAHGGRIWIEDADGHSGAKFVIALPAGEDEGPALLSSRQHHG